MTTLMTKTRCGRGGEMEIPLEEGLSLAPRIQNYLEESGIFTYRDLLYWTLKVTDEDSIDAALDIPVILPPTHMQLYLRQHSILALRDLLGAHDAERFRRR